MGEGRAGRVVASGHCSRGLGPGRVRTAKPSRQGDPPHLVSRLRPDARSLPSRRRASESNRSPDRARRWASADLRRTRRGRESRPWNTCSRVHRAHQCSAGGAVMALSLLTSGHNRRACFPPRVILVGTSQAQSRASTGEAAGGSMAVRSHNETERSPGACGWSARKCLMLQGFSRSPGVGTGRPSVVDHQAHPTPPERHRDRAAPPRAGGASKNGRGGPGGIAAALGCAWAARGAGCGGGRC